MHLTKSYRKPPTPQSEFGFLNFLESLWLNRRQKLKQMTSAPAPIAARWGAPILFLRSHAHSDVRCACNGDQVILSITYPTFESQLYIGKISHFKNFSVAQLRHTTI